MDELAKVLLAQLAWVVPVVFGFVILKMADWLFGIKLTKIIELMLRECRAMIRVNATKEGVNAFAVAGSFILGLVAIVLKEPIAQQISDLHFGQGQPETFYGSLNMAIIFVFCIAMALVSFWAITRSDK